jgi:AGCS family alanine or glycine:cation symporter
MTFKELLQSVNYSCTLWVVFPAMILLGIYLSFKLRLLQIAHLKTGFQHLKQKNASGEGNISRFEALSTVLAGNFGTGNISGMAMAIAAGGPGALIWMWIMVFFGSIIQYASCVLGVLFRKKNPSGEYVGGPMYYLRDGSKYPGIATCFALFTIFGALTVGNCVQINSVILPLQQAGFNPFYCSLAIAALVGIVILGGIKRIAFFASYIVPFKALLYLAVAWIILASHYDQIIPAFKMMFDQAFDFSSILGGGLGFGLLKAMTTGFERGIFATDAGTGIVPILQASARSKHPVIDGMTTLVSPLMVMIVCTTTGLILIVTGAWQEPGLQSTNMVTFAFTKGLNSSIGGFIVAISLILFAYTTILAWAYCGEKALGFLIGPNKERAFRFLFIAVVPLSSFLRVEVLWSLADLAITLMLITNLIGIAKLSGLVIRSSREFSPLDLIKN